MGAAQVQRGTHRRRPVGKVIVVDHLRLHVDRIVAVGAPLPGGGGGVDHHVRGVVDAANTVQPPKLATKRTICLRHGACALARGV